jgi:hypothetical protein
MKVAIPYIPKELLHIILDYYGKIKYKKGNYINIIHKNDYRYDMISLVLNKKKKIIETMEFDGLNFYFELEFDKIKNVGLCYDYNFSYKNKLEICYYDFRTDLIQRRTYL